VHEQFSKKHGWIDDAGIYVHAKFEVKQNSVQGETKRKEHKIGMHVHRS